MAFQHPALASGRWHQLSLPEQMGNIGSEISRACRWQEKDSALCGKAIDRALELIDLTLSDPRWRQRLKEITRLRELLCRIYLHEPSFQTDFNDLDRYCMAFAVVARSKTFGVRAEETVE